MVLGGGAFGLGLESEALMNGISALIRDTLNSLLALSIISVCSKQMAIYVWTRKQALTKPDHAGTLALDFQDSRTVRNKFMLFINWLVYGIFVIVAWTKT